MRDWTLTHDGAPHSEWDTEAEALAALHRAQPQSWQYATTYGGWAVYCRERRVL